MSCTLPFDECLIEGRCASSPNGSGGRTCTNGPGEDWQATFGGDETQRTLAVAIDDCDGDVVVIGDMNRSMTVQPAGESVPAIGAVSDMFVARFTANGALRYAKSFGSSNGADVVSAADLAIDDSGNAVVVGGFSGTVDFGAGAVTSNASQRDAFVASYSSTGKLRWLQTFGGNQQDDARAVTIDPGDGHIWVTGAHQSGANFFGEQPSADGEDAFVLRMTPDGKQPSQGDFFWRLTGASAQIGEAIRVDDQRVYVAGTFQTEIDPLFEAPTAGDLGSNVFVAGLVKDGTNDWISTIMGDGEEVEPHLELAFGVVMVTANTFGSVSGCASHTSTTDAIIVAGFTPSIGTCVDFVAIGGPGDDSVRSTAINGDGKLMLLGTYTADLVTPSLVAEDTSDLFVIEMDDVKTPLRTERLNADGLNDDAGGIAFGRNDERVIGGSFSQRIVQGNDATTTVGGIDGFLQYRAP